MLSCNMPLCMIVTFLLFIFVIGFSGKVTSLREYAVGHKQFGTATLVASVLATAYGGGGLVHAVEQIYSKGFFCMVTVLSGVFFCFWMLSWLALRMAPFMNHLSMPDTVGNVYGKYPRAIAALSSIYCAIAVMAIQIAVMSWIFSMSVNSVHPRIITIFTTIVLIFYSALGGIRAITLAHLFQFIPCVIIIFLLAWFLFVKTDKPAWEIIPFLQGYEKFQFSNGFHFKTMVGGLALVLTNLMSYVDPMVIQRVYIAADSNQARKVFLYASFFNFFISIVILLTGFLFYIKVPTCLIIDIWGHLMALMPPILKVFFSISLLAITMTTAASCLNTCVVIVSHDIVEIVRGERAAASIHQLLLIRLTSLIVGLSAMLLGFYCNDLLKLLLWAYNLFIPVVTAPFILASFGFQGTSRTALIGMTTGMLAILAWNKWIKPETGIDGTFICMVANGLAMIVVHYLWPQSVNSGWFQPSDERKQNRQIVAQKQARRKRELRYIFIRENLAKLKPSNTKLTWIGFYAMISTLVVFFIVGKVDYIWWHIFQLVIGACFVGYAFVPVKRVEVDWIVGFYWLVGLFFCLVANCMWHWCHMVNPIFSLTLSFFHLAVTLFILPLPLGIVLVMVTFLTALYPIYKGWEVMVQHGNALLSLLGVGLLFFCSIVYHKLKVTAYEKQYYYLKHQQKLKKEQKLKQIAYSLNIDPATTRSSPEEEGAILEKIVGDVTQSISFLDDSPLYKQDFQSIINKFSEWAMFLKKRAKSKDHMLLLPTEIALDELIHKLEIALEGEVGCVPRLFVEKNGILPDKIVCDVTQTTYLFVAAILYMIDVDRVETQFVKMQLYATNLKYERSDPVHHTDPLMMTFPAMAIVIDSAPDSEVELPKIKNYYKYIRDSKVPKRNYHNIASERVDFNKKTIERIINAHYGYLAFPTSMQSVMLLVLPWNVTSIRDEMIAKLPMERLTSETPITSKEEGESMMLLMEFHEYVCKVSSVDPGLIAEILLLLRRCYGFKRHPSGELFYVRSVGIAQLVAEWLFHSPKPIYAALLYDLVRYTRLPLSYIKANYNLGIFYFVQNVLSVDKHQEMVLSELYVGNRFKQAVSEEQLSVLYIKLAERLYDLQHATGYINQEEVKFMIKETLTVDIELAKQYLDADIAVALETAALHAQKICQEKTVVS